MEFRDYLPGFNVSWKLTLQYASNLSYNHCWPLRVVHFSTSEMCKCYHGYTLVLSAFLPTSHVQWQCVQAWHTLSSSLFRHSQHVKTLSAWHVQLLHDRVYVGRRPTTPVRPNLHSMTFTTLAHTFVVLRNTGRGLRYWRSCMLFWGMLGSDESQALGFLVYFDEDPRPKTALQTEIAETKTKA